MSKNTSITLGDHFENFISMQIQQGRYASVSEAVRDALRLLEERETKIKALRQALIAGEESGACIPFDFDAFIQKNINR